MIIIGRREKCSNTKRRSNRCFRSWSKKQKKWCLSVSSSQFVHIYRFKRSTQGIASISPSNMVIAAKMVRGRKIEMILLLLLLQLMAAANVTYDHRALVIDGKRRVLISGSIHYPRSTPEVNTITTLLRIYTYGYVCIYNCRFLFCFLGRCGQTLYRNLRTVVWML